MTQITSIDVDDLIGLPFAWGGRGPDAYDCYGLAIEILRRIGKKLPEYLSPNTIRDASECIGEAQKWEHLWVKVPIEVGRVLVFNIKGRHTHIGVVIDKYRFAHSWEAGGGVIVEDMREWKHRIEGAYEYVG